MLCDLTDLFEAGLLIHLVLMIERGHDGSGLVGGLFHRGVHLR